MVEETGELGENPQTLDRQPLSCHMPTCIINIIESQVLILKELQQFSKGKTLGFEVVSNYEPDHH